MMNNFYPVVASVAQPTEGGESGSQLKFEPSTIIFSIVNIIILFILLKLILFKPVTNMMNARTEKIKKNIDDAQNNKIESEKLKEEYRAQLEKIKEEANTIINNAHQKAQVEAEELLKKTKAEAEGILKSAREQGQREVEKALEEVKNQVATLALQAASKVIQQNMDNESNRKLVQEFIDEVGAA